MKTNNELDIDMSFKKLDKIIEDISKDNISIEKSIKLYEDGTKILKGLKKSIDKVEKRIEVLSEE